MGSAGSDSLLADSVRVFIHECFVRVLELFALITPGRSRTMNVESGRNRVSASFPSPRNMLILNWLPRMDSNHGKVIQSPSIYSRVDSQ